MKLSKERVASLSRSIIERLIRGRYIELKLDPSAAAAILERITTDELMVEDRLNEEVRQILKAYEAEFDKGKLDYRKMFLMTKKQVAKDRGIIL